MIGMTKAALTSYSSLVSVWKMSLSWQRAGHSGGYRQQAELCTEMVQAEQ